MSKNSALNELIHDFQGKLHGICQTIGTIGVQIYKDPDYCISVIDLATEKKDGMMADWLKIKKEIRNLEENSEKM